MFQELTNEQWAVLAPLLPPPARTGRPRANDRQTLNGIIYVLATGCRWQREGVWDRLWQALLGALEQRQHLDWEHAVLDSSTVPAKKGGAR